MVITKITIVKNNWNKHYFISIIINFIETCFHSFLQLRCKVIAVLEKNYFYLILFSKVLRHDGMKHSVDGTASPLQWWNSKSSKWQVIKVTSLQRGKLSKRHVIKAASHQSGKSSKWLVIKAASLQIGKSSKQQVIKAASHQDGVSSNALCGGKSLKLHELTLLIK